MFFPPGCSAGHMSPRSNFTPDVRPRIRSGACSRHPHFCWGVPPRGPRTRFPMGRHRLEDCLGPQARSTPRKPGAQGGCGRTPKGMNTVEGCCASALQTNPKMTVATGGLEGQCRVTAPSCPLGLPLTTRRHGLPLVDHRSSRNPELTRFLGLRQCTLNRRVSENGVPRCSTTAT